MGCFDYVRHRCACGGELEWQTKGGECDFTSYQATCLPPSIAGDLDGESTSCGECGREHTIRTMCLVRVEEN